MTQELCGSSSAYGFKTPTVCPYADNSTSRGTDTVRAIRQSEQQLDSRLLLHGSDSGSEHTLPVFTGRVHSLTVKHITNAGLYVQLIKSKKFIKQLNTHRKAHQTMGEV